MRFLAAHQQVSHLSDPWTMGSNPLRQFFALMALHIVLGDANDYDLFDYGHIAYKLLFHIYVHWLFGVVYL